MLCLHNCIMGLTTEGFLCPCTCLFSPWLNRATDFSISWLHILFCPSNLCLWPYFECWTTVNIRVSLVLICFTVCCFLIKFMTSTAHWSNLSSFYRSINWLDVNFTYLHCKIKVEIVFFICISAFLALYIHFICIFTWLSLTR